MGACCSCEKAFLTKTAAEWEEIFTAADIWFTPVKAFTEVQADKQARSIGSFVQPGPSCSNVQTTLPTPPDPRLGYE